MYTATSAKICVKLAGNLRGIPGIPILADAIVALTETCENIPKKKQNIGELQKRCVNLLEVLDAETSQGLSTSKRLEEAISEASEAISRSEKLMKRRVKKNRWKWFLRSGSIDHDVTTCTNEIDRITEKLQLLFHAQIRRDMSELVEQMHTVIVSTTNKQGGYFPQNAEDGYNVVKEMQQAYRNIETTGEEGKRRFNTLRENILKLQENFGIVLPNARLVDNEIQITSDLPIRRGGVYDLYPGTYLGREVWCKKLSYGDPNGKAVMRLGREIDIWSKLWKKDQEQRRSENTPPRVLPLYGFYIPREGTMYLVNAKPERGTLREVLRSGKEVDSLKIIKGIAKVLLLVHTMNPPIFHGDLNCASVVIDKDGNPLLQDFRLSKTSFDVTGQIKMSQAIEGDNPGDIEPVRWMAPETLNSRVASTRSDIWSLGMVMYEILTGKDPYHEYPMFTAIAKVAGGETPQRPEIIVDDEIWDLMVDCWTMKPRERPPIQDVIGRLEDL